MAEYVDKAELVENEEQPEDREEQTNHHTTHTGRFQKQIHIIRITDRSK